MIKMCSLHKRIDQAFARVEDAFAKSSIAEVLADTLNSTPMCDGECNGNGKAKLAEAKVASA